MEITSLSKSLADVKETTDLSLDSNRAKIKVLMLGPSLNHQGGMASVEKLLMHCVANEIEVQHISTYEEGASFNRLWIFLVAISKLFGKLWRHQVDILHVHFSERASVFRAVIWILIARLFRKPIIMHSHGAQFDAFYDSVPKLIQKVIDLSFQQCSCLIVLSQSWQDYYIMRCKLSPEKVVVLINPVQLPAQIPERRNVQVVSFVCLGRIGQRKGSFDLLNAFAKLPIAKQQKAKLILAGDGEVEEARRLSRKLGIANHVECLGWLNAESCGQLLETSDVFVLPSYAEGLPMAILEAMSWGLPVISTPVGGIPEVVISNQHGILVEPGNIPKLTEALQVLLDNEDLRIDLGKSARRQVEPLDIQDYRARLAYIYRNIYQG